MTIDLHIVDNYKKLSQEEKREKLIWLLEIFSSYRNEINQIIWFIKQWKISDQDMIEMYTSIVHEINTIEKERLEKWMKKIVSFHKKINILQKVEESEKNKEWDPDELLNVL